MRIISEFHDYYDAIQKVAQDRSVVYLRKRKEAEFARGWPFPASVGFNPYISPEFRSTTYIIGFCGRIDPAVRLSKLKVAEKPEAKAICFNVAEVDEFMETYLKRRQLEDYRSKEWTSFSRWAPFPKRRGFEEFFAECEKKKDAYGGLFLEHNCPVFVATRDGRENESGIVYNGSLKEVEFFRVVDPATAFQEIQMFLGGRAQPFKEVPEIPDTTMAEAKGFDKWSFRKEPKKGG